MHESTLIIIVCMHIAEMMAKWLCGCDDDDDGDDDWEEEEVEAGEDEKKTKATPIQRGSSECVCARRCVFAFGYI